MTVIRFPDPLGRPSAEAWADMTARSERYTSVVVRLLGFWLCAGEPDDGGAFPSHGLNLPPHSETLAAVPSYAALTDDEQQFVHAGALAVLYQSDAGSALREMYRDWIAGGACE